MRLIDADALKETIDREIFRHDTIDHVFQIIDGAPTIEPKQGEWMDRSDGIEGAWNYCSVCGEQAIDLYDFCPNCGARMKGADDEV